jgi:hypothetical protein
MPEPTDMIAPMLQRIQADIAETRRDLGRQVEEVKQTLSQHGEKLDAIEGYVTYGLGLTSRNISDIKTLKAEVAALKERMDALEQR